MTVTRQHVVGALLLFSAGSVAAGAYTIATRDEAARPASGGEQSGTGTVVGGSPDAPADPADPGTPPAGVFTISGRVSGLVPGRTAALPLRVTNPNAFAIQVLTLDTAVREPAGCPAGSLDVGDYAFATGDTAVSAPANGTVSVSVPVRLADSPTQDQSGCAGATFALSFTGTAVEAP